MKDDLKTPNQYPGDIFALKVRENYLQVIDNIQQAGRETILESQRQTRASSK